MSSCWSQIVTSLLKCHEVIAWYNFQESLQLSVPHLSAFAKWCSELPVMHEKGRQVSRVSPLSLSP